MKYAANLALHLGKRGVRARAVDLHHPVVPRQVAALRRLPPAHQLEPLRAAYPPAAVLDAEQMRHLVERVVTFGRIALVNPSK